MSTHLDKTGNQSTQVAFLLIEEMSSAGDSMRLTDLARRLEMPKARVYRFLQTLVHLGYVVQDDRDDRYRLTLKLFHLGQAVADGTQLTSVAKPVMVRLRDTLEQTTTLSIPEPTGMRVVDIVRVESPVQIVTRPGALLAFHASAQGKLALAFGDPQNWNTVTDKKMAKLTESTNVDEKVLHDQVALARQRGWAVAPEETLRGVNALSAPIFDAANNFTATITIAGSVQDILAEPDPAQVREVCAAARAISGSLGCTEYRR